MSYICDSAFLSVFSHKFICAMRAKQCEIYAKEREKEKNNTWIPVYFCINQLWRHSTCQVIQQGNRLAFQLPVADSFQSLKNNQSTIYSLFVILFYEVADFDLIRLSTHAQYK